MPQFANDPSNSQVEWYRRWAQEQGQDTSNYSNEEITNFLGSYYSRNGLSNDQMEQNYGSDFSNAYLDIKNRPDPNQGYFDEFSDALGSATSGMMSTGAGALGLGAGAVGLDGVEDYFMGKAGEYQEEASQNRQTIGSASDVRWDRPDEVARFLLGGIGEVAPSVVETAGAFALGGGVGGIVGKTMAKKAIKKAIAERTKGTASEATEMWMSEIAKREARRGVATGSKIATGISSLGLGMGEIYTELHPYTQLDESHEDYVDPTDARQIATSFGAVSGSLDFLGATALLGKLTGASNGVAKQYYKRLLMGLPEGVIIEGATEAAQEFINFAADKYAKGEEAELTDQDVDRLWDAGILGAIGGTGFTAVGAIKGPKEEVADNKTPDLGGETITDKQSDLLQSLKKNRAVEEVTFSDGDEVQIALGDKGTVKEIIGDEATIEMPDGTLKSNVPVRSLSIPIPEAEDIKVDPMEDITPKDITSPESNTKVQVTESGRKVPITPINEPKVDVIVGGVKVTSGTTEDGKDATLQAPQSDVDAANKIYKKLKEQADNGEMSRNTALANKTGGWASNDRGSLKLHLGDDYKLLNNNVRALLKSAGHINSSNEWLHETERDKGFKAKQTEELNENRRSFLSRAKWLKEGAEVNVKVRGEEPIPGTIEEIDSETGLVTVNGKKYDPKTQIKAIIQRVKKSNPKPTLGGLGYPSSPTSIVQQQAEDDAKKENAPIWTPEDLEINGDDLSQARDKVLPELMAEGEPSSEEERLSQELALELATEEEAKNAQMARPLTTPDGTVVKEIDLLYTSKKGKGRKKEVITIKGNTRQELSDAFRAEVEKQKRSSNSVFLDHFYGVTVNGTEGDVSFDAEKASDATSFSLGGLEVSTTDPMFFEKRKGDIEFPIFSLTLDPNFDNNIDQNSGKPKGKELREDMGEGGVVLVIRQDGTDDPQNPYGSVRVVTAKLAKHEKRQTLKVYDSLSGKMLRLKGTAGKQAGTKVLDSYSVIGKITTDKKLGNIDLYFDDEESFNQTEKIQDGLENKGEITERETKKALIALNAEVDKAKAKVDALEEELENQGKPTKEELAEAEEEVSVSAKVGWDTGGEITQEIGDAIAFIGQVDFSSADKFEETIKKAGLAETDRETVEKLVSAIGVDGGNTKNEVVASLMAGIFNRFVQQGIDPSAAGPNLRRFAEQYVDYQGRAQPLASNRKAHKYLKEKGKPIDDKAVAKIAKKKADKRVAKLRSELKKAVNQLKQEEAKVADYTGAGTDAQAKLDKLEAFRLENENNPELTESQRLEAFQRKKAQLFPGEFRQSSEFNTGKAFEVALDQASEAKPDEDIYGTEVTPGDSASAVATPDTSFDDEAESQRQGETAENKADEDLSEEVAGEALGRELVTMDNLKNDDFQSMLLSTPAFSDRTVKLVDQWKDLKRDQDLDNDAFWSKADKLLTDLYEAYVGKTIAKENVDNLSQLSEDTWFEYRDAFKSFLQYSDNGNLTKLASQAREKGVTKGKNSLKEGSPIDVFMSALMADGHYFKSEGMSAFTDHVANLIGNPVMDAWKRDLDDLLGILDRDGLYDKDSLREILYEIYDVKESEGFTDTIEYLTLLEHGRILVNPDYRVKHIVETSTIQGKKLLDPLEEGKMNNGKRRIDEEIDPTTGRVAIDQLVVTSQETNDASIINARASEQSYSASPENPLDSHPELQESGRKAMEDFAPGGLGVPFSLTTALNQIKASGIKVAEIANISRLLDNKILKEFTVEFMAWDDFRQYASPAKGILNKAVILQEERRIIISEGFNNSYDYTATQNLMADILHEAVHAVTRPALDLAYALSTGKKSVMDAALAKHGTPSNFNMSSEALVKIWNNVNDVLLPYLREKGKSRLDLLYGLTSIDEFFSELASDAKFKDFLANTELPASLRPPRSKLRSVLDWVMNLLARLGFSTAKTPDALEYARGELSKLVEISNQSTSLTEHIEALNLRKINTLGRSLEPDTNYDELLEQISRGATPESETESIAKVWNAARGSVPKGTQSQEGGRKGRGETQGRSAGALQEYLKENGLLLDHEEFNKKLGKGNFSGEEHDVYEESGRWFKRARKNRPYNITVASYMERLLLHNHLFPNTAYTLEGFTQQDGELLPVVSQDGVPYDGDYGYASEEDVIAHMQGLGFSFKMDDNFLDGVFRLGNLQLTDLFGSNTLQNNGEIYVIDNVIKQAMSGATMQGSMFYAPEYPRTSKEPGWINQVPEVLDEGIATLDNLKRRTNRLEHKLHQKTLFNILSPKKVKTFVKQVKAHDKIESKLNKLQSDFNEKAGGKNSKSVIEVMELAIAEGDKRGPMLKALLNKHRKLLESARIFKYSSPDSGEGGYAWNNWIGINSGQTSKYVRDPTGTLLHEVAHLVTVSAMMDSTISPWLRYSFKEDAREGIDNGDYEETWLNWKENAMQAMAFSDSKELVNLVDAYMSYVNYTGQVRSAAVEFYRAGKITEADLNTILGNRARKTLPKIMRDLGRIDPELLESSINNKESVAYYALQSVDKTYGLTNHLEFISRIFDGREMIAEDLQDMGTRDKLLDPTEKLYKVKSRKMSNDWIADVGDSDEILKAVRFRDERVNIWERLKEAFTALIGWAPDLTNYLLEISTSMQSISNDDTKFPNAATGYRGPSDKALFDKSDTKKGGTTIQGSKFEEPVRPVNPRPDDNARVMAEANAAGFNELEAELVKVHREVGEALGMEVKDFLDTYGKPGSAKPSEIRRILNKELEQHGKESENISIESAGLNRVARSWGVRKAISNLEKVREKARKNQSRLVMEADKIEQDEIDNRNYYTALVNGKIPPRDKLGERVRKRVVDTKFETLEAYVRALPNSGFSQANLNSIGELTADQMLDIMDAVIEARGGELEFESKEAFLDRLESMNDSRLNPIMGDSLNQKARRFAVMRALKESKDVMSIVRLSKNMIGTQQENFRTAASKIASARSEAEIDRVDVNFPGTMSTALKHFAGARKDDILNRRVSQRRRAEAEVYNKINDSLGDRSIRLRMSMGELEPVSIHDGVTLLTMEKVDGEWQRGNFVVKIKGGKFEDREGFIKANRDTLLFVRDPEMIKKYGDQPWFDIMREQANMAMNEPTTEEHFHIQRAAWYSGLQGLSERFNKLGYHGTKLSQMTSRTISLFRDYTSKSQALSKQFNTSLEKVMGKLKIGGQEMYTGLYQDIFWWYDNHPEFAGKEEEGFKALWKHLRANANVPDRSLLDDDARRLIVDMTTKAISARNWEAGVNKKLGNRVRDEQVKVESFVNGEMVDFYREPLEMGYATMPRSLNNGYLRSTHDMMGKAGWHSEDVSGIFEELGGVTSSDSMGEIYDSLFTEQVVAKFVKPYTNTDVRQSVFKGPGDENGDSLDLGNAFVSDAFDKSGGNVFGMANYIFDQVSHDKSDKARVEWQKHFLRQFRKRYRQLDSVANRVKNQTEGIDTGGEKMVATPQSMDARHVESRLPKEFFYYNMYDEVSSNIRIAMIVATSQFGRNGQNANIAYQDGKNTLGTKFQKFNAVMAEATKSDHQKPWTRYSSTVKRRAYEILRAENKDEGYSAEKEWNELYSASIAMGELDIAFDHLGRYYGKDNVAGPYQDANLLIDLLGVQSMMVLNNPKSSMWQAMSLFEFPNAFRGMNKMAGKATAASFGNMINQTFGGLIEAIGFELPKAGRAAQWLNSTHFRTEEMELPWKEYRTQVGNGGALAEQITKHPALGMKRYIRKLQMLSTHHRKYNKDGTRAPIDPLTLLTGIFPYVNNVVNHSIGVGAITAYEDMLFRMADIIDQRGITEYSELTAEDLGLGGSMFEIFKGEEDGYDRMNELLVSSGAPSMSRLAFDFADRRKSDKEAMPLSKDQALMINHLAMNQVSGDGFNAKPAFLANNPALKYFSHFLGWPLGKMGRDLQQIHRDANDKLSSRRALVKYIGMLSAVYVPSGLSLAMLIDWYDEEMLEKPNNLPPVSPWAVLPVIGPFIAARDPNFSVYSITARMAKAGVPFGMGMDVANGIFAKGDPYGAAREISLDSRIFAWSMFKNIYDAMGTWMVAGEFDWQLIGRPIAYGVGGNSVIQMMDLTSAIMDIDSEERRVADYIGLRNHIKKTAWMMGLPLRPPFKGGGRQSGVSVNTRQMARAAYAGDSESFLQNYQEAIEDAKTYLAERGRVGESPEKYVAERYKERDLRMGITAGRISDSDWNNLLNLLDPEVRNKIESSIMSHEHYLKLIGGTPRVSREKSSFEKLEEARRRAATIMGY